MELDNGLYKKSKQEGHVLLSAEGKPVSMVMNFIHAVSGPVSLSTI